MKGSEYVILLDDCEVDNFINYKIIDRFNVSNIRVFDKPSKALHYFKTAIIPPTHFFIDLNMPLINGIEFITEYKRFKISEHPAIFFILSASLNPEDKIKTKKCGAEFIEKPLTLEKLKTLFKNNYVHHSINSIHLK